jgi:hypothetical protein
MSNPFTSSQTPFTASQTPFTASQTPFTASQPGNIFSPTIPTTPISKKRPQVCPDAPRKRGSAGPNSKALRGAISKIDERDDEILLLRAQLAQSKIENALLQQEITKLKSARAQAIAVLAE